MNFVNLIVDDDAVEEQTFLEAAHRWQSCLQFVFRDELPSQSLTITNSPMDTLFAIEPGKGVTVSAWKSGPIAHCMGLSGDEFLLLCGLAGLIQLRCLELNPLLICEDLLHRMPSTCLYALKHSRTRLLLNGESPRICRPCQEFYRCLGLELEIGELKSFLGAIRHPSH